MTLSDGDRAGICCTKICKYKGVTQRCSIVKPKLVTKEKIAILIKLKLLYQGLFIFLLILIPAKKLKPNVIIIMHIVPQLSNALDIGEFKGFVIEIPAIPTAKGITAANMAARYGLFLFLLFIQPKITNTNIAKSDSTSNAKKAR